MLCNGGNRIDATIIKDILNQDGTSEEKEEIKEYINNKLGITDFNNEELDIKKENIDLVLEGMKSVTTETGGTAYGVFKDFDIEIGGKTGSAETANGVNAWFVGFAPYEEPQIAVVVLNQVVRPFTAKWHRKKLKGAFNNPNECDNFREELSDIQIKLIDYSHLLAKLAMVEDMTLLCEDDYQIDGI